MTRLLVVITLGWFVFHRFRPGGGTLGAVLAGSVLVSPLVAAAVGSVAVARTRWRRAAAVKQRGALVEADATLLADLVALGLTAGLSVRGALEEARPHLGSYLGDDVDRLLDDMERRGAAAALSAASGALEPIGRVASAAALSGAPLASAIAAHATARRRTEHAARVTAARRLPVRLLLPLALLILPGFVLLAVGPALLQALARLGTAP
ncbi:MAG: type II secretion system F family protein [Acidimicrobiia bacterium]